MKAQDFTEHLTKDIIPFWNRMKDEENGGFYGFADANGVPDKTADKGVLLTCRILWFYAAAVRFLAENDPGYDTAPLKENADHAFRFFAEHCLDHKNGGVYWTVKADGSISDSTKYTYNMAFAIYALSAYYEACGRKEALDAAYALFQLIGTVCRDEKGYLEAFDRNFVPVANDALSENGVMADRTMNTLLHMLESYTEFYRVCHNAEAGAELKEILDAFRTVVYNPLEKRCEVFFDNGFHSLIDLDSYGHNIETSWLIDRACEVLKDPAVTESMQPVIFGLAEGALLNGIDPANGALNYECENGKVKRTKAWWPQAEAMIGFYNAWQKGFKAPEGMDFRMAAEAVWDFVRGTVIDKEQGEWIENVEADGKVCSGQPLVHLWKCPYHTGRVCMEMARRLR